MRHYKARFELKGSPIHAIEVWFDAENIIAAGNYIADKLMPSGVETGDIVKLIEIDEPK